MQFIFFDICFDKSFWHIHLFEMLNADHPVDTICALGFGRVGDKYYIQILTWICRFRKE